MSKPPRRFVGKAAASCTNSTYSQHGLTWTKGAVRMNHIQVFGTHNSYHYEVPYEAKNAEISLLGNSKRYWYSHASMDVQATYMAIRQFELDIWPDPEGGNYAQPLILGLANVTGPPAEVMSRPGTKIMHIPDVDVWASCYTLVSCLTVIRDWSKAHPKHVPISIMTEFKLGTNFASQGGAKTLYWNDTANLAALDAEFRSVFSEDEMITPDHVRRGNLTLEQSILNYGWPDLESARGRVMFLMDSSFASINEAYTQDRPSLEGRVVFTNSQPGFPDCAFQKLNHPYTAELQANIQEQVKANYWVRTFADDTISTIFNTSYKDHALASGAQLMSTDYPAFGMSSRWMVEYAARFEGGVSAKCNVVTATERCNDDDLEPAEYVSR
ncbi:acid phosphatase [Thozetella sp. PMI_491]|nr:acid phosphatase [Thozetella sp. PMI_491]